MKNTIGIGLYGNNGHQVHNELPHVSQARLAAIAAFDRAKLPAGMNCRQYESLVELLADPGVEMVCLCSPRRVDQAADAIACLRAGKHVYAEKPAAMCEKDLDAILSAAQQSGRQFHEMAGTAFEQPYLSMRSVVQLGILGTVVQVFAQKSYPYYEDRPQDEQIDGGLILQNAIHALRMIEQVGMVPIAHIQAMQTQLGNPKTGGLNMAASLMMRLANGGVAVAIANYFNPNGMGRWGNETLRIFGTKGMLEATDGATRTRLVVGKQDYGPIDNSASDPSYFARLVNSLCWGEPMPLSLSDEISPTRWAIRALETAVAAGNDL